MSGLKRTAGIRTGNLLIVQVVKKKLTQITKWVPVNFAHGLLRCHTEVAPLSWTIINRGAPLPTGRISASSRQLHRLHHAV